MKLRGILFDKDGTVVDYARTWLPINREAALACAGGPGAICDRLLLAGGHDPVTNRARPGSPLVAGTAADIAEVWAPLLPGRRVEELTARIDQIFVTGAVRHAVAVDRLAETLEVLRARGLILGLATSDNERAAHDTLKHLDVAAAFTFVCGYDSGHGLKPGPGMVLAFCRATGLSPAEVLVVGDSLHDLHMAQAAGARGIGVLTGPATAEWLTPHAEAVLPSLADLPAWLDASLGHNLD